MARKKTKANRLKTCRSNKLTLMLVALLLVVLGLMLQSLTEQLTYAQEEYDSYARRLEVLQKKNEQLRRDIENSDDPSLIEEIARNELGMASHGEKIFRFSH